jgi:CubicO group peptidase (beta-lactamase class C family)
MIKQSSFLFLILFLLSGCSEDPVSNDPPDFLQYVQPEDVGWSSQKLAQITPQIEQSGYAAMMAVYDGKVFYTWGNLSYNYFCHSIRKPFLSALYGIHVAEGNINLDATIGQLNIDDIPPVLTEAEKQATVRDLLKSRSGIYHEAAAETPEMAAMRPERGSHPPDTYFYYNNWDFNALGTIFEQETGKKIFEEFNTRIAGPIGMQDFDISNCLYQYEEDKSEHPAYHFRMSARDMARVGVLYQQNGNWDGIQLIPENWIEESTTAYSIADSTMGIGYGYMWRIFPPGSIVEELVGYSGYYHTGVGVHALIIIPDLKLVIVQRYDTDGEWTDPGEIGLQIGVQIINARQE